MHIDTLIDRVPALVGCRVEIAQAFKAMSAAYRAGGKVLICGNGGSASDAEHWAGELLKGFRKRRSLREDEKAKMPAYLAEHPQGALPTIPLTGFNALSTAFANDVAPELTFAQLVWGMGKASDVFIGISTSEDAKYVCAGAQAARARGLFTIGLTGESGGALKPLCDLTICVPSRETYHIQEFHLPIYHCLSMMLEDEFF